MADLKNGAKSKEDYIFQALHVYNLFVIKEYGDEELSPLKFRELESGKGKLDILNSTFEAKGYDEELDMQVSYDLENEEYIVDILNDDKNYKEKCEIVQFINDLKSCSFDDLYNYFVDKSRENLGYEYCDEDEEDWENE